MKIILLQDISKLGKKYDVKNVRGGYGRNFLLPRKMAELAIPGNLKNLEAKKIAEEKRKKTFKEKITQTLESLRSKEITLSVQANEKGELYGSVSETMVAEELKKQGFNVDEEYIKLKEKIKKAGEYEIEVNIGELKSVFKLKIFGSNK